MLGSLGELSSLDVQAISQTRYSSALGFGRWFSLIHPFIHSCSPFFVNILLVFLKTPQARPVRSKNLYAKMNAAVSRMRTRCFLTPGHVCFNLFLELL